MGSESTIFAPVNAMSALLSPPRSPTSSHFSRMSRQLAMLALLALFLPFSASAQAPTPADIANANRAAEQIQREQQERQQQQLQKDIQRGGERAPQETPEAKPPSLPKGGVCREIREIVFTGVTLLSQETLQAIAAPFQGKCLYARDIEQLLGEVLKAYIDRGYIAVRPYLRAQDLSGGRLEILIVEGRVSGFILKDGGRHSVNLATAFPGLAGKPLNLRDIEQGLDQINRLASNGATMEISPGDAAGDSLVNIVNNPGFPLGGSVSVNNQGSTSTGAYQGSLTLSLDHPLGLNDFITLTHGLTLFDPKPDRDATSDSFFYSIPFGYWTLQLSGNRSRYHTPVPTATRTLVASGDSDSVRLELNRVAYRDRDQKLTALVGITRKSSENYLDGQYLSVSSRDLAIVDLGVNWSRRFPGWSANLNLGVAKGMDWFNALEDAAGTPAASPHAQGAKLTYGGGVQFPFTALAREFSFSSQISGQYALDALYGSEQISLGSHYSVRGFNRNSLAGDRGFYLRNELSTALPGFAGIAPRLFLGLDGGRIAGYHATPAATLSGAALGLRFAGKYLSAEISVEKSLKVPGSLARESALCAASVSASF